MTASQPPRRFILSWITPKNLLVILLFILFTILVEYIIIAQATPSLQDPTAFTIPVINITLSLLYHLLPLTVVIALTATFIHLTTQAVIIPKKPQISKKPIPPRTSQKPSRLRSLRQFYKKLQRGARDIRNKIPKVPPTIRNAFTIIATFIIIFVLATIMAYPALVAGVTANLYRTDSAFLSFIIATLQGSESIAQAVPPLGAVASAIHNALIGASLGFYNTFNGAASVITRGLVSLGPTEKYLIAQNAAAWLATLLALLYTQYAKARRFRR